MTIINYHSLKKLTYRSKGFTLIEMMIAMVLGLLVISGAITVFSGSSKNIELNRALTDIQDSARFAMDSMMRDVRMAGFQGCVDINTAKAKIIADDAPTDNYYTSALTASSINASGVWTPTAPIGFTPPTTAGKPIPGTHVLSVQFGNSVTYTFAPLATNRTSVVLDANDSGLVAGDLALISNCQVADIFAVTAASTTTLQHGVGKNNDARFSAPYGRSGNDNGARVMRFEANIYYIGDTTRENVSGDKVFSLYKQTLPYNTDNPPIEMIEGVANMKVKLGFRDPDNGDENGLIFIAPENSASTSGRVEVVQIGLLMQSYDPILDENDTSTYYIAGTALAVSDAPVDPSTSYARDKRLKLAFNSSVKIRNRR